MGAFGFVELKGAGDRFQDAVGDAGEVAAFEAGVVVDAHAGEHGDFLATQPRHTAAAVVDGQADLLWCDPGPPGGQELANVVPVVHDDQRYDRSGRGVGGSVITWNNVTFPA